MSHTKGPWEVRAGHDTQVGADIEIVNAKGFIACASTMHQGAVNAEANARLIAAAPDLLEAARKADPVLERTWLHAKQHMGTMENQAHEALQAVRAAIAKAKGQ